jgi:small subunit ribosomal protein S15
MYGYQKEQVVKHFQRKDLDTGSPEVQIALLTFRIRELTEHFKVHKKDNHSREGLVTLVNRRKKLLTYLKGKNPTRYNTLLGELDLRK